MRSGHGEAGAAVGDSGGRSPYVESKSLRKIAPMPQPLPPETDMPEAAIPELVRLYLRNILFGFMLALVFTGLLVGMDVANLRHLTLETRGGWLGIVMLVVFNTIVFAGVQFAIAVMRMADPGDGPRRGNPAPLTGRASGASGVPVAVPARSRRG